MSENTELTVSQPQSTSVTTQQPTRAARFTPEQIESAQIHDAMTEIPSIVGDHVKLSPLGLSDDYWSPEKEGETKHVWVIGIDPREIIDMETGEPKLVDCVRFAQHTDDGRVTRCHTASAILVSTIRSAIERGEIIPSTFLTPIAVTYTGLRRTKSGRNAARWDIRPIVVSVQ